MKHNKNQPHSGVEGEAPTALPVEGAASRGFASTRSKIADFAESNQQAPKTDSLKYERAWWARSFLRVAGVDEVGRGCLAGPVVAASVIFAPNLLIPGVDDSKKLSPKRREELFPIITHNALAVGIGMVESVEIDRINILQASRKAMKIAVESLSIVPDAVLVDGRDALDLALPQETIIDGDALSHAIAAASIIAKVTRDRMMAAFSRQFPNFGFANHKGYGTRDHLSEIQQHGPTPIHRRSFKGVVNG